MLHLVRRLRTSPPESAISDLESLSESISRQLGAWIESLKDSDYQGHRYNNSATREAARQKQRREVFLNELQRIRETGRSDADPKPPGSDS